MSTRIPREETKLLQAATKFRIKLDQCPRDTQTGSTGLPADSAAIAQNQYVKLVCGFGRQQRLAYGRPRRLRHEILLERTLVDGDLSLARTKENARDGSLPAARPEKLH